MSAQIFVNLPVQDLTKSIEFFRSLGYQHNPAFTDENASCIVLDDGSYVMLLTKPFFRKFTDREIVDATTGTEVIVCLGVDSRERVDEIADAALSAGGRAGHFSADEGGMYGRSFQDLDGHLWEVVHMDMSEMAGEG